MNEFNEDKWSRAQCLLDGQVAADFNGLEGSYFAAESNGKTPAQWAEEAAEPIARVVKLVADIEHKARRRHWTSELARLGVQAEAPSRETARKEVSSK